MGKHARRQQIATRLRALGAPTKLYRGSKFAVYRLLNGYMRELAWKTQFKPGDVVGDCDYQNHVIAHPLFGRMSLTDWGRRGVKRQRFSRRGHVVRLDQFQFTDGRWSCGCPSGPDLPMTDAEIAWWRPALHA